MERRAFRVPGFLMLVVLLAGAGALVWWGLDTQGLTSEQAEARVAIGISAAAMYGQLTTGKPIRVTSRVGKGKATHVFDIQIDTRKNEPVVTHDETLGQWHQEHGTRVELEIGDIDLLELTLRCEFIRILSALEPTKS